MMELPINMSAFEPTSVNIYVLVRGGSTELLKVCAVLAAMVDNRSHYVFLVSIGHCRLMFT